MAAINNDSKPIAILNENGKVVLHETEEMTELRSLCKKAMEQFTKQRNNDPEYTKRYNYYEIDNPELIETLRESYTIWKQVVKDISNGELTLSDKLMDSRDPYLLETIVIGEWPLS